LIVSGANGLTTVGVTTLNGVDNFGVVVPSFGVVTGSLMGGVVGNLTGGGVGNLTGGVSIVVFGVVVSFPVDGDDSQRIPGGHTQRVPSATSPPVHFGLTGVVDIFGVVTVDGIVTVDGVVGPTSHPRKVGALPFAQFVGGTVVIVVLVGVPGVIGKIGRTGGVVLIFTSLHMLLASGA